MKIFYLGTTELISTRLTAQLCCKTHTKNLQRGNWNKLELYWRKTTSQKPCGHLNSLDAIETEIGWNYWKNVF